MFLSMETISNIFVSYLKMKRHNLESMTQFFAVQSQSQLTIGLKGLLLVLLSFVTSSGLTQGWELSFGGTKEDQGQSVLQTADGGYVVAGYSESFGSDNDLDIYVVRTDVDGTELWSKVFDEGVMEHGYSMIQVEDGGFLIVGDIQFPGQQADVYLLRVDPDGKMGWSRTYGEADVFETGRDIIATPDGGYLIVGTTKDGENGEDDILAIKIDENGDEIWTRNYGTALDDIALSVVNFNDGYAFVGNTDNPAGTNTDIVLSHIDSEGAEVWSKYISTDQAEEGHDLVVTQDGGIVITGYQGFSADLLLTKYSAAGDSLWTTIVDVYGEGEAGNAIIELADGTLVITGIIEVTGANVDVLIATFNADGGDFWFTHIGNDETADFGQDISNTMDGGYVIAGYNSLLVNFFNDLTLIKTDVGGNVLTNFIEGHVFVDVDEDCPEMSEPDFGDIPLEDWIVQIKGENNTYFGTTDENGFYNVRVDTGSYDVSILIPNDYWAACIDNGEYDLPPITDFYETALANFPILPAVECPYLEVDVSANWQELPGCFDAEYTVKYGNMGTTTAEAAYVEVTLDDDLTFNSASITPSDMDGNVYTFQVGDLLSLEKGSFTINATVDCDVELLQASVVGAHIYPDSICLEPDPNWDGSSIVVEGECQLDSIEFRIINIGQDMDTMLNFIIVEDHVLFREGMFQLNFLQNVSEKVPANGSTYRIIADQSPLHLGNNYPTVAIEGCVVEEGDDYSTGYVDEFPENDQDSHISIDVQEIGGSEMPVEMRGYPRGYKDSLIEANTDITYLISFRNLGTDTIHRVVIRDTLSAHLDITSIIPGTSSHPYNFEVYDSGILKITLSDIQLLPGGSAEEASTRGFVKFRIAQKPDNPLSTKINNSAAIFFDFDAPVQTNIVTHTIGEFPEDLDPIIVSDDEVYVPGLKINIYPNPFAEFTTIELSGVDFETVDFTVFDLNGRVIKRDQFRGNQFHFYRNHLPAGLFIYKLESEGRLINSGKILVR